MAKNVGCMIVTGFSRPERTLVEKFANLPVANIDDCMNRTAAVCNEIFPLNKTKLLGTAFTVKVAQGDNLMFHKAMDLAEPGDVVVIDAGGFTDRAIFGELMIQYCQKRGLAGVIVDGAIRDSDTLSEMNFPVYARGITPDGPYKNGPGEIGTIISFGGRIVRPGDIIVGDQDGIVVIKPEEAEELAAKAEAVLAKETKIAETIQNEGTYIRPWVEEKLQEIGCEYIGK